MGSELEKGVGEELLGFEGAMIAVRVWGYQFRNDP